jgi:hypothetical protein
MTWECCCLPAWQCLRDYAERLLCGHAIPWDGDSRVLVVRVWLCRLFLGGLKPKQVRKAAFNALEQCKCIVRAGFDPIAYPVFANRVLRIKSLGMLVRGLSIPARLWGPKPLPFQAHSPSPAAR